MMKLILILILENKKYCLYINYFLKIFNLNILKFNIIYIVKQEYTWGLGIGDWGFGVWGLGPNPKPPIPNPQSPIPIQTYLSNIVFYLILNEKNK